MSNVEPTKAATCSTAAAEQQQQQQQQQQHICKGCANAFPSRSALFRHLQQTNAICLNEIDRQHYIQHLHDTNQMKRERILLLYGYYIPPIYENYLLPQNNGNHNGIPDVKRPSSILDHSPSINTATTKDPIQNGEDVAQLIVQVIEMYSNKKFKLTHRETTVAASGTATTSSATTISTNTTATTTTTTCLSDTDMNNGTDNNNTNSNNGTKPLIQRSYGHSRSNHLEQEAGTSAITEVMMIKVVPLLTQTSTAINEWMDEINLELSNTLHNILHSTAHICLLGRQLLPMKHKFHPELDVSHRRIEYLLPAEFLLPVSSSNADESTSNENLQLLHELPSFNEESRHRPLNEPLIPSDSHVTNSENETTPLTTKATLPVIPFQRPNDILLHLLTRYKKLMKLLTTHVIDLDLADIAAVTEKQFHNQKRRKQQQLHQQQQRFSKKQQRELRNENGSKLGDENSMDELYTEKKDEIGKATRDSMLQQQNIQISDDVVEVQMSAPTSTTTISTTNDKVLRRKRYHNFTPTVMAHEYLSYRRMDRFYHRATFRMMNHDNLRNANEFDESDNQVISRRPYFALSISGDMFLTGQICRVVGLFVALARNIIDEEFVNCVFDESYPHLVPTPPLPTFGLYATDVYYITVEGKIKSILTPRNIDRYKNGWNDPDTIQRVRDWQTKVRQYVAQSWIRLGYTTEKTPTDDRGALLAEQQWTKTILEPWSIRAKEQLNDYRAWKLQQKQSTLLPTSIGESTNNSTVDDISATNVRTKSEAPTHGSLVPVVRDVGTIPNVDPTVPPLYEKVLYYLRKANESGLWPSTTPKRQLVMISNVTTTSIPTDDSDGDTGTTTKTTVKPLASSLAMAHSMAKNNKMSKSSAYVFVEGQGGASGSFSLGAMPGDKCAQPKGNELFPELMEAAFQLEMALCPHRTPSSTIAVNRNAQFRPHTDSGAGSGQSTSLIVGLGTYSGGELMVEGKCMNIRYQPVEFDGWKQRHWTMPFVGERYSLVWFTPKGCEGVHFYQPPS